MSLLSLQSPMRGRALLLVAGAFLRLLIVLLLPSAAAAQATPAATADTGWPAYNGGYTADRYSPLSQITTANVASLVEVGRCTLPETTSFQCGPVVVGDTMYLTTATGTYAADARSGKLLWSHKYAAKSLGLGTPVRGVAYADGRLYRGTPDGHVIALDAKAGTVVWDVSAADGAGGEYFTVAPILWDGRLYIGTSGSDVGTIGHAMALDPKDGSKLWTWDVVPATGPGAETWPSDPTKRKAGGGMYSSFALDTDTATLYIPTGNPGPDFAGDYRPGSNLYTCSAVMLDAKSGAMKGYYQTVAHDVHDWDVAASPVLYTSKSGRKMVAVAGKNGYVYGLTRDLGTVLFRTPVTTIKNEKAPLTREGTYFQPGTQGGVNWYGPAYSPTQNALYVPAIDWGTNLKLGGPETLTGHTPGKPFLGSSNNFGDSPLPGRCGWLTAVDADNGTPRWKYRDADPLVAGVTPTAGGVVFTGNFAGNLLAFDAATGKLLLTKPAGGAVGGGIVTYTVGGTQYVAVAAGMTNQILQTKSGPAVVTIFALPPSAASGAAAR